MSKYPAKSHAIRTANQLKTFVKERSYSGLSLEQAEQCLIYICGTKAQLWPYSDQSVPFRQDRYFNYLSGVDDIPSCHLVFDVGKQYLTLYLPPIDPEDVMWSGMPTSLAEAKQLYDVDEVKYSPDLPKHLGTGLGITMHQVGEFPDLLVTPLLKDALDETRMIKDEFEIELMLKAGEITDNSHLAVMSALPIETNEGHIHAEFVYHAMRQGSKFQAYDPICCSGTDCGTLHYVRNDQTLQDKQLVLIDAGAEWKTYAADVTRVFPINGVWSTEARQIYDLVDEMQDETMTKVAPGVLWDDLHKLAHKVLIDGFLKLGIFKKEFSAEEIFNARTSAGFFPHGLGHLIGMDTHDVGGKPNYDDPDIMMRYLRLRRPLQTNMVVTVEPGVYFNKFLIEPLLSDEKHAKYIDVNVLHKYWAVGGVRLEDDVWVTATGYENLTKITKDADEVSKIVTDGIKKGRNHFHVVV
jgi:Xaa-Pro dipeptidase